jgi:hypothetical protein
MKDGALLEINCRPLFAKEKLRGSIKGIVFIAKTRWSKYITD